MRKDPTVWRRISPPRRIPKRRTECPVCGMALSSGAASYTVRRSVYAEHMRKVHVELGIRERSLFSDEMIRMEAEA